MVQGSIQDQPVRDGGHYAICLQEYHYKNSESCFNLTAQALTVLAPPQVVTTSFREMVEEYLGSHQNLGSQIEGRLVYT